MSHNQTGSQHRWLCSDGCCGNKGMEMLRNNAQEGLPEYEQCSFFINATRSRLYWYKARWHHAFMVFMTNSDPVNLTCCEVKDPCLHTFLLLLFPSHQFKWVWLFSSQQFIFKKIGKQINISFLSQTITWLPTLYLFRREVTIPAPLLHSSKGFLLKTKQAEWCQSELLPFRNTQTLSCRNLVTKYARLLWFVAPV